MGGLPGRLLREFAVTLSVAIGISLIISLTLTPMMCGWMLKRSKPHSQPRRKGVWPFPVGNAGRVRKIAEVGAQPYAAGWSGACRHHRAQHLAVYLHPENLLPGQDTGVLMGGIG